MIWNPSHRQLLVDISEGLSQEDLKSVLFLLGCQIPKGRLETVKVIAMSLGCLYTDTETGCEELMMNV